MKNDELTICNARIWTGDAARPWAQTLRIGGGRIVALDPRSGSGHETSSRREFIDAACRVVVPGLIDSHVHLLKGGQSLNETDLSTVRSRDEFERAIAHAHASLPADRWLIGRGWSQENWPDHAMPDKSWLDGVEDRLGGRPCVCYRMDMHAGVVNEPVLRMCGAADRADPSGGRIERDRASGAPTGLMIEAALWQLVNPLIPPLDLVARRDCLRAAQAHAHRLGLTAVGSMEYFADVEEVFRPFADGLTLRCQVTLMDRDWPLDVTAAMNFENLDRLKVIGFKTFIDGTLGSRTARMLADYADDPGNRGLLLELAGDGHLRDWIRLVAHNNLSPSMHAIGDEAARLALEAIGSLPVEIRRSVRPRIEHAQQIDRADIARFRDVIASMQPLHKADDARYVERRLGRDRTAGTFAFRRLLEAGGILAFGSDWPVVSLDPMLGMRAAITGLTLDDQPFGIDQNLTVEEALRAYTRDAAYCLRLDGEGGAGVLREGMAGDCVMFDVDPFTADWAQAGRLPRVIMTIVGGEVVFDETE
jgi:predicted amidohydrolase YtcJ